MSVNRHVNELSVIQKAYDLILWYIPIINRLPRDHKFALGDRITTGLYELHAGLILARYDQERIKRLELLNGMTDVLRHQTRLLLDLQLIAPERYHHAAGLINAIGSEIGGWLKEQRVKHEATR